MAYIICKYGKGGGGSVPDGKTVTPINDVEVWQQCAGLAVAYDTLSEVLSDSGYVRALMASDNAVDYMIRSTAWSTVVSVPTMTSNTTPGGECFGESVQSGSYYYGAFDKVINDSSNAYKFVSNGHKPSYVGYKFTQPVNIGRFEITPSARDIPTNFILQGSNNGSDWIDIQTYTDLTMSGLVTKSFDVANSSSYEYYRLYVLETNESSRSYVQIVELNFYSASIVESETAMQYIGASDYASTQVLTNSVWREAIGNSDYIESVLNVKVPTMTSNTAPYGTAFSGTSTDSSHPAYYSFDNNSSTLTAVSGTPKYVGYEFTADVKVYRCTFNSSYATGTGFLEASNDSTTWNEIAEYSYANNNMDIYANPASYYKSWRVRGTSSGSMDIKTMQFYGRKSGGVQTWLTAANIEKNYYTLAQVLADTTTLAALMNSTDAVDYLVTVKSWINDITANEAAMTAIGNNNYAANTLLANSDWRTGICNSTYFESVLNTKVPVMTSDTTPSGECICSSAYQDQQAYKVFDNDTSTSWSNGTTNAGYVGYIFNSPVSIARFDVFQRTLGNYNGTTEVIKAEGSNTGNVNDWYDISDSYTWVCIVTSGAANTSYICNDIKKYKYIRLYTSATSNPSVLPTLASLQFYGRQDV